MDLKILVVSLLRLGDLLMQKNLLPGLFRKFPTAEVHFLIRSEFQSAEIFFPEVKAFHLFDAKRWQNQMHQPNQNILRPLKELSDLVDDINKEKFDLVFNWTHQKGSAYLLELFHAPQKQGLQTNGGQFVLGDNIWLKKFNDEFANLSPSRHHYLEYLSKIFGLELAPPPHAERAYRPGRSNQIVVQPLTSDLKKNWSLKHFKRWIWMHRQNFPSDKIILLGAPSESQQLNEEFKNEDVRILSLVEAFQLLSESDVLVTGDTAIKHLGALARLTTIELALGSAQPTKTYAWLHPLHILEPQVSCYPCSHSRNCPQPSHFCGDALVPEKIENLFFQFQGGNKWEMKPKTTFPQLSNDLNWPTSRF